MDTHPNQLVKNIKPCPFCGRRVQFGCGPHWAAIECPHCNAGMYLNGMDMQKWRELAARKLAQRWNRRKA